MGDIHRKKKKGPDRDEVEQLLRQTQDDILLKLSINSHSTSSSIIDPDLDRRFNALKSNNKKQQPIITPPSANTVVPTQTTSSNDDGDDLFARFSALKNTNNKNKSGSSSKDSFVEKQLKLTEFDDLGDGVGEEDEVEKLIKWAVDAARLDPSPPSDDEEDNEEEEVSDSDDDDDVIDKGKKCKRK